MLVENARAMALDVEQKVASANVFAEQVRHAGGAASAAASFSPGRLSAKRWRVLHAHHKETTAVLAQVPYTACFQPEQHSGPC